MSTPEKIGRYEIIQQLGQGGMAVVYLARDPLMDRQVAVKLLPRQLTYNESLRGRFQNEARIVASLEHPAIVPVNDFGEFNEQPYLVMRYMVGGSLGEHTKGKPQSLPEIVRILSPLSQALDKAHSQHIIHRDLKPDNILFDADRNPYLSDFGIARLAEGTQTTSIMGTPAYMSPEQIKGDMKLDGRSDIYALGVILFELLSGVQPYTGETPTQVMMKHVLEPVPVILDLASDLPPMTQLIIERAMAKDRDDRYDTAEELVAAVKDLLTASQAAEVGAAIAGTMLQETMLEIPDPSPAKVAVPVTPPASRSPVIATVQSEPAAGAPELAKKDSPSRGRQFLLLGCAVIVLIVLCLVAFSVIGSFINDEVPVEPEIDLEATLTSAVAGTSEVNVVELPSPTPLPEAAATETVEPTPVQAEPTPEPQEYSEPAFQFSDNFDGKTSMENWELWQDETAEFRIANGKLTAVSYDSDTLSWVKQIDFYSDLELSVAADILEGNRSAFFGAVFDGPGDDYVGCFVQGDNSAYCGESLDGETEYSDWAIVDLSILRENEILFVISDGEWAMAVNDKCIGSGFVDFIPDGQPALAVSTADEAEAVLIAYDNYQVRTPTAKGLAFLQCEPEYYE